MTDGNIDIALVKYDSEDSSNEAKAAGEGPCIHHIGFEVDDFEARIEEIKGKGYEIISNPGVVPVKFRAPGGTIAEFAPRAHCKLDARIIHSRGIAGRNRRLALQRFGHRPFAPSGP